MVKTMADMLTSSPHLALIPAGALGILYFASKAKVAGIVSAAWVLYAAYEWLNLLSITCSGECNIRIDLLLIYPALLVLSVAALVSGALRLSRRVG